MMTINQVPPDVAVWAADEFINYFKNFTNLEEYLRAVKKSVITQSSCLFDIKDEFFNSDIHPEDIKSCSMGAGGEDVVMARAAREKFPFSVECKNVEKLNVWDAYEQAKANSSGYEPIVVMKKNHKKPLVVLDAEHFIEIIKDNVSS